MSTLQHILTIVWT